MNKLYQRGMFQIITRVCWCYGNNKTFYSGNNFFLLLTGYQIRLCEALHSFTQYIQTNRLTLTSNRPKIYLSEI
jgi:hypothetical protein